MPLDPLDDYSNRSDYSETGEGIGGQESSSLDGPQVHVEGNYCGEEFEGSDDDLLL